MSTTPIAASFASGLSRRVFLTLSVSMAAARAVQAKPVVPPRATSLRDALSHALQSGNPLLVLVSLEGCPFCRVARENYLEPLRAQGTPWVQVDMHVSTGLLDFDGKASTHEQLVRAWQVKTAPTVLFFGREGRELAPRLVGGSLSDFYGAYLDERLAQARAALKDG